MVNVIDAAFGVPGFFPPGRQGHRGIGFMPAGFLRPVVDVKGLVRRRVHHLFPLVVAAHECGSAVAVWKGGGAWVKTRGALHLTWAGKGRGEGMSEVIIGPATGAHSPLDVDDDDGLGLSWLACVLCVCSVRGA